MSIYDRRSFLKRTAMFGAAAAACGPSLLPSVNGMPARLSRQSSVHPFFAQMKNLPEVIAHRGGDGQWPGETLYAMRQAIKAGADILEMDVYLTKKDVDKDPTKKCQPRGGELVLMHDKDAGHTTQCPPDKGCDLNRLTLSEVQKLNAGSKWSNDGNKSFPYKEYDASLTKEIPNDLRVPTLEEVFREFSQTNTRMVVEMKKAPDESSPVCRLCELIELYQMQDRVLVASFHRPFMDAFRKNLPAVATSVTPPFDDWKTAFNSLQGAVKELGKFLLSLAKDSGNPGPKPVAIQLPHELLSDDVVKIVNMLKPRLKIHAWTVNDLVAMSRMRKLGVDGIITDYPGPLLAMLGRVKPA